MNSTTSAAFQNLNLIKNVPKRVDSFCPLSNRQSFFSVVTMVTIQKAAYYVGKRIDSVDTNK